MRLPHLEPQAEGRSVILDRWAARLYSVYQWSAVSGVFGYNKLYDVNLIEPHEPLSDVD